MKITLKQWAKNHGLHPSSARQKALRGNFETAEKIGRDWFIDEDEENIDHRITTGEYINWRKK
jgi:hypothetical protein